MSESSDAKNDARNYEGRIAILRGALEFLACETTEHSPTATRNYARAALDDDAHTEFVLRQKRARALRLKVGPRD